MSRAVITRLAVCRTPVLPVLSTDGLFDKRGRYTRQSPISEFFVRLRQINVLAPKPGDDFNSLQAQLVLLGVVASVDSFVRTLMTRAILIDTKAQEAVQKIEVSYAAARHLPVDLLPEALSEKYSFSSSARIEDALKQLLGIKGSLEPGLAEALRYYNRVCHLRHCAVHRFGKLGSANAVALGLEQHRDLLEKPLQLDYGALQNCILICTVLATSLNNFVFHELLYRLPIADWTNDYSVDRPQFMAYYNSFADKASIAQTLPPKALYNMYMRSR